MRIRSIGLLAAFVGTVGLGPVHATPCNLVSDPAGDPFLGNTAAADPDLDILSADIATDSDSLKAVFRMARVPHLDLRGGTSTMIGMKFWVGPDIYQVAVETTGSLRSYDFWKGTADLLDFAGNYRSGAWGVADTAADEYRIDIPFSAISDLLPVTSGTTTFTDIEMEADYIYSVPAGPAHEAVASVVGNLYPGVAVIFEHAYASGDYVTGDVNCAS